MSTHFYLRAINFRGGAIAAISTLAFAATAASANPQDSRYGDIYDYESGQNCGQACVAPPAAQPVRAPAYVPPQAVTGPPIYIDCSVMGSCAPQASTVYTQPQTSYSQHTTYSSAPLNCPAGTTPQADGTCLQSSNRAVDIYQGDAQTSYGYQSSGASTDYRPIRK